MTNQLNREANLRGRTRCGKKNRSVPTDYQKPSFTFRWMVLLISLILFTLLLPFMANAAPPIDPYQGPSPEEDVIVWGPYITNTTHNSTIIHWKSLEPTIGRVSFILAGTHSPGISSLALSEEHPSLLHHVQLNNLKPGQRYSYWIGNNSLNYSFRTLPLDGPFTFIVYGDTREQLPGWNQLTHHAVVAERIAKEPDSLFVVHTGDLVRDPDDEGEWGRFFEAAGPMLANTTFYPVPGNHEGNLSVYHEIFGVLPWYSYECGDARFIIIDSNTLTPAMASDQDRWLNESMGNNSTWNFVFLHHPLYTSEVNHWGGYADLREKWGPVFQTAGVDAVFSAHVHAYEHFQVNRIHYFTVATGGAPSYTLSTKKPDGYVYSMENILGYVRVTMDSQQVSLEFVPVAEVKDQQVVVLPEGIVGERVIITKFLPEQETFLSHFFKRSTPSFSKPIRIFN
jgi:acid phosphatase type 7